MDANGTRFHMLLGAKDWGDCLLDPETLDQPSAIEAGNACLDQVQTEPIRLAQAWAYAAERLPALPPGWDETCFAEALSKLAVPDWDEHRTELTLPALLFQFTKAPKDISPPLTIRRAAATDIYDNLYWIADDEQAILVKSAGSGQTAPFWSVGEAVSGEAEAALGGFHTCAPVSPAPLRLRGLAVTREHYLVVGVLEPAGLLIFDLHGGGPPTQVVWPAPPAGSPAFAPFDLAATPDGGVWILDRERVAPQMARLWALNRRFEVVVLRPTTSVSFAALPDFAPVGGQSTSSGAACMPPTALSYSAALILRSGNPEWVPLVEQKRPRYDTEATLLTPLRTPDELALPSLRPAFDSGQPDCVWHRLMLDACIPLDSSVEVWSRAANSERDLAFAPWQPEPRLYCRGDGSEIPFWGVGSALAGTQPQDGTWELLFQQARGRFLQLKIRLSGNGRTSPRLRALRVYYPRFSYVEQYLPAAYRQDANSASFLERFLANPEGLYTALEDKIANVQLLFDVRSVPAEYLDWLAGWFGAVLDATWDETRRRLFVAHAAELFAQRGTLPGLIRAIRLATDPQPDETLFTDAGPASCRRALSVRIVEQFRTRRAPGLIFGDPTQTEGPGLTTEVSAWTPEQGAGPLHERFHAYLQTVYASLQALNQAWNSAYASFEAIQMPPVKPDPAVFAADWEKFLRAWLGFTYAPAEQADQSIYQAFLARRYGYVAQLNQAYGRVGANAYASFDQIDLPTSLPVSGPPLRDWIQFVSVVLPTWQKAHRFTVLISTVTGAQTAERAALLERVRQVVKLEKPVHTTFDVKEFWALFRVGEARLELDTLIDQGSRLAPMALDAGYLAQGYLNYSHPWQATNRMVLAATEFE